MKLSLDAAGVLTVAFEKAERKVVEAVLEASREHYAADFDALPEALKKHWRGRLFSGRPSTIPGADAAAEDLAEARLEWRAERLETVGKWLAPGGPFGPKGNGILVLTPDEIDVFFAVLNDRRLSLAALYHVTEDHMAADVEAIRPAELQQVVWEIHLLAFVMESCLQCLQEAKSDGPQEG
ncbi:MAG TPA: hypothetical protein VIM58_09790 [Candidatus Methylacidiphilales bacterium]